MKYGNKNVFTQFLIYQLIRLFITLHYVQIRNFTFYSPSQCKRIKIQTTTNYRCENAIFKIIVRLQCSEEILIVNSSPYQIYKNLSFPNMEVVNTAGQTLSNQTALLLKIYFYFMVPEQRNFMTINYLFHHNFSFESYKSKKIRCKIQKGYLPIRKQLKLGGFLNKTSVF